MPIRAIVEAPAKVNLALDITGIAENGYHLLDMLMQAIGLSERVEVSKSMGYSLRLPKSRVKANEKNTATKAAAAFFRETGLLAGADIVVHKATPTRAGLGGGSADAAAVLVALNELYGARLSLTELCEIGLTVGSDVPFALVGGTARVEGVGEIITPLKTLPPCFFAIGMPQSGVSTPAAFELYDQTGGAVHPDVAAGAAAINAGNLAALYPHMQNALEETSGGETAAAMRRILHAAGAATAVMTGSGAAVFGVFTAESGAQTAAKQLEQNGFTAYVTRPVAHGARVVQLD